MKRKSRLQPKLDRRELLALGGAAAAVFMAPAGAANARRTGTMLALADLRYSDGLLFARGLDRLGVRTLPVSNLARVWFDFIEPRLQGGFRLTGLTLESDLFVLERLAGPTGARTRFLGLHDWRCRPGAAHSLCGSIGLAPIEAALVGGEDRWAEKLGAALVASTEQDEERRRRNLIGDRARPAADSPKFFVSWLMDWRS
ncbi:MAG: hypothetical protein WBE08_03940 [Methyloceanibacter sp.]|jgi:hypothetical protein